MDQQQITVVGLLAAAMALFVWGRFRYDMVAVFVLLAGYALGAIPADGMFAGFSNDIVIVVASALVMSAAVSRSGVVEMLLHSLQGRLATTASQVAFLSSTVAIASMVIKNIGALSIFMPVAFKAAQRSGLSPAPLLMPMSFASLLGGLVTLVGTSPNIIVSQSREELLGAPFGMFDFAPVGLGLTVVGVVFLSLAYRLLPHGRRAAAAAEAAFNISAYATEAAVGPDSPVAGKTVGELAAQAGNVEVVRVVRGALERTRPPKSLVLAADDVLVLRGEPDALERFIAAGKLTLARQHAVPKAEQSGDEIGVMEAIITADSPLIGRSARQHLLFERHGLNLLAVSRSGERLSKRLNTIALKAGDAIVLQGNLRYMNETLGELQCLPLAERSIGFGRSYRPFLPLVILLSAMLLVALGVLPVGVGLFGAAAIAVAAGAISLREAYGAVDWPILVLIAALIPLSNAVQTTGLTEIIAGGLMSVAQGLPDWATIAMVIFVAMAVTPFLNNAATVLLMAPVAVALAGRLHVSVDGLLMAVTVGAGCDFLTPIGHQCNTLVMGAGGYRFSDFVRLGLPLSLLVLVSAVVLIGWVWPLSPQ